MVYLAAREGDTLTHLLETDQTAIDQEFAGIVTAWRRRARSDSPVTGCPDCLIPQYGRKAYCHLHRCRAVKRNGQQCSYPVTNGRDYDR